MSKTIIEKRSLSKYIDYCISNTDCFTTYIFQNENAERNLVTNFFKSLLSSEDMVLTNDNSLFNIYSDTETFERISKREFINLCDQVKITAVVIENVGMRLKCDGRNLDIENSLYISFADKPSNGPIDQVFISFTPDLFSEFLPINKETYEYDPDSKFPNPDWEYNTKIMYKILEYPLEHFKFIEAYRHIKDAEFAYYSEEQVKKNLLRYTGQ